MKEQLMVKRRYAMGKWFVVIIACLLVGIFACSNPASDFLRIKYSSASSAMSSITNEEGEIDTSAVSNVLNKGIATPYAEGGKTYISDLKMATDYYSAETAKKALEKAGYTVIDQDMNEGTGYGYSFLGYKTTTNKDDAITDISMMNMNGGYRMMDYKDVTSKNNENTQKLVKEVKTMVSEWRSKENPVSFTGELAYSGLNKMSVTLGQEKVGLGDILVNPLYDDAFNKYVTWEDLLFKVNSSVAGGIYNYLTYAVLDQTGDSSGEDMPGVKNWMQKIEYEDIINGWDLYYEKVSGIMGILSDFAVACARALQIYKEKGEKIFTIEKSAEQIMKEFQESDMESAVEDDTESIYLESYWKLQSHAYGDGTLADLFVPLDENGELTDLHVESFYPLIKALTPGQYSAIRTGNLLTLINSARISKEGFEQAKEKLDLVRFVDNDGQQLTSVDLFYGVNKDEDSFDEQVGITDELYREAHAKGNYDVLTGERKIDNIMTQVNMWAGIATSAVFVVTGGIQAVGAIAALFTKSVIATAVAATMKVVAASLVCSVANWACLVIAVCIALYYLVDWLIGIYDYYHPTYTTIPKVMFDGKNFETVKYDVVMDGVTGEPGDLNNYNGKEWNAVYYTKDTRAGDPLMVNNADSSVFKVQKGDSHTPGGYEPVTRFGEYNAYNTNANAYKDKFMGIYLFYLVDGSLTADKVQQEGTYISHVLMRTEKTEDAAKYYLTNLGYKVFEVNLTAELQDTATYIGYKTTNLKDKALTDIRVAFGTNQTPLLWGGASYAMCGYSGEDVGKNDKGVDNAIGSADYALYATADKNRGSAIYSGFYARNDNNNPILGDEPINLFSGGGSFNFRTTDVSEYMYQYLKPIFVYFKPSVKYTSGDEYLAGFYTLEERKSVSIDKASEYDYYPKFTGKDTGIINYNADPNKWARDKTYYTTTFNPKRAIADISMYDPIAESAANATSWIMVPDNLQAKGTGYMACEFFRKLGHQGSSGMQLGSYQQNVRNDTKAIYVAPSSATAKPIKMSEIRITSNPTLPYGYKSVTTFDNLYSADAVAINNPEFDKQTYNGTPYYIHFKGAVPKKPKYIGSIMPSYSPVDNYAHDYAILGAYGMKAEEYIDYNLNDEEVDYRYGTMGFSRINAKAKALTDIAMYYVKGDVPSTDLTKETCTVPPGEITKNYVKYTLASQTPIYVGRQFYLFFYVTTSEIAGDPIQSFYFDENPYNFDGTEGVKILSSGYDSLQGFYFMHLNKGNKQKYINQFSIAGKHRYGETYFNTGTFNYVGEAWTDEKDYPKMHLLQDGSTRYFDVNLSENTLDDFKMHLGYSRSNSRAGAITDIIARTPDNNYSYDSDGWRDDFYNNFKETYVDSRGITYKHGVTYAMGYPVMLYYTTDTAAGAPITNIEIHTSPKTTNSGTNGTVRFTPECHVANNNGYADLNLYAAKYDKNKSTSIFLYITHENDGIKSSGKGTSVASVFSDPGAMLMICFAIVMSSGITSLIMYGRNKKKKRFLNKY